MNLRKYLIENTAHNIIYCSMFSGNPRFKKLLVNVYVFDELASVFLLKAANKSKDTFLFVVLQKPLASGKEDEIEKFINDCGATIVNRKKVRVDSKLIAKHYRQFSGKKIFFPLIKYFTGQVITVWLVNGDMKTLTKMRDKIGSHEVEKDSFRYDLVGSSYKKVFDEIGILDNGIHVSDSSEEGEREAKIWFPPH